MSQPRGSSRLVSANRFRKATKSRLCWYLCFTDNDNVSQHSMHNAVSAKHSWNQTMCHLSKTNRRVFNRSAGIISSRFPRDIFTKIQQNLQFYRHLPGRVTNPWDHTDPVYQAIAQLKDIYRGLIAPISINPGLLPDVFYWYTVKYKNSESARKFPVDFQDFQEGKIISVDFQEC